MAGDSDAPRALFEHAGLALARLDPVSSLQETERRLAAVFRVAPVALAVLRWSDHRYVDINEAFTDLFGWTRDEVLGKTPGELNIPVPAPGPTAQLRDHLPLYERAGLLRARKRRHREQTDGEPFATRETRSYEVAHVHGLWHLDFHQGSRPVLTGAGERAIDLLQGALATEIVCVLRYTMHAVAATGLASEGPKAEFAQHAHEEQGP